LTPEDILNKSEPATPITAQILSSKSPSAYPDNPHDERLATVGNAGHSVANKQPELESQPDTSLSESVLQYINSTSPSEMQRLLNMFNASSHPDLWPQSGLSLANNLTEENQGSALTRTPPRLDKAQNGIDFNLQTSDPWGTIPLSLDSSTGVDLTSLNSEANYQNVLSSTDDLHSRINLVDFDINNLIQNFPNLDDLNWDFEDTLNIPGSESGPNDIGSVRLDVAYDNPQSETVPRLVGEETQTSDQPAFNFTLDSGQNSSQSIPLPSSGFVSEITPSAASSPTSIGEATPDNPSLNHKRKASKPARGSSKSQPAKKRRTSK
jgi:hypothetical protein